MPRNPNYNEIKHCEHCKKRVFPSDETQIKINNKWVSLCEICYSKLKREEQMEDKTPKQYFTNFLLHKKYVFAIVVYSHIVTLKEGDYFKIRQFNEDKLCKLKKIEINGELTSLIYDLIK